MPLPTNIHTLLSGNVVEWARIEFKQSWKPEASLKTICAFANDIDNWGGGYIVLGVEDDNGRPKFPIQGIEINEIDSIMKDLLNKCKQIKPDYLPIAAPVDYDENTKLIVVWCPGGQTRPYRSPVSFEYRAGRAIASREDVYFIRKMASTVKPSETELADLFSLANHVPFDDRICHQAELSDLNITLIKAYLREIGSSLYEEVDRFYNYPYAAIEEALANAVYHKAYDIREPIEVRIEKDKIEILSFPGPDRSVTIEGLRTYRVTNRRYRNRRIGEFLKELHLTEGRNTGFRKILNALERNGSPKPEF